MWKYIVGKIDSYSHLGRKTTPNGTVLVGHAPHVGPEAWLHKIYPPLSNKTIVLLEKQLGRKIPHVYKEFLSQNANGLKLFIDALSLEGFGERASRSVEDSYVPYSLVLSNVLEPPANFEDDLFIIGSYSYDGSLLYIDVNTEKVFCSKDDDLEPLVEWENFEEMLVSEVDRLCNLFGKDGTIEEEGLTLPY